MKDMAILVPTRGRPKNFQELLGACQATQTASDVIAIIDEDDVSVNDYASLTSQIIIAPKQGKGMAKPLNYAAKYLVDDYAHFCFLGDDHRPRTMNWDARFIQTLDQMGVGLVYGDDLLQGERLATAVAMTGNIVYGLGGMVPPNMIHLYLDDFWMKLGRDLNALRYCADVILEHLHPVAGKAEWDDNYRAVNAEDVYSADRQAFLSFIESDDYAHLLTYLKSAQ